MATDYLSYVPGVQAAGMLGMDPNQPYATAAQGAKDAQAQANALSQLQWERQMAGLGQAQGFVNNLQSLYNSIYSPGGGAPAMGGQGIPQMSQSEMDRLSAPPSTATTAPPEESLGSKVWHMVPIGAADKALGGKISRGGKSVIQGLKGMI